MSYYESNEEMAKHCLDCTFLHIGIEVSHNHCDKSGASRDMESRTNGRGNDIRDVKGGFEYGIYNKCDDFESMQQNPPNKSINGIPKVLSVFISDG